MSLRIHCDGCGELKKSAAVALLQTQSRLVASEVGFSSAVTVRVQLEGAEHLCHACRKRALALAITKITIDEWWDPS